MKQINQIEFGQLVSHVRPQLVAMARRFVNDDDAEDLVQDTLLRLWDIRGKLNEYEKPEALAHVILKNLCLMHLRKQRTLELAVSSPSTPYEDMENKETDFWLRHDMEYLPPGQLIIIRMKQTEGMSITEIAEALQMREDAVRQQLSKARKKLLQHYKDRR